MSSIFIDGNYVATLCCGWCELPPRQTPCGLAGSCLPTSSVQEKVMRYSINFEDQTIPFHDGMSYNVAVNTLVTYLSTFPPTSKIGIGCFLYGPGPMYSKICKNRNKICLNVVRAILMVRDMFTSADMSRDEQGDPALDALVEPDFDDSDSDSDSDSHSDDNDNEDKKCEFGTQEMWTHIYNCL